MITGLAFIPNTKKISYIRVSGNTHQKGLQRDLQQLSIILNKNKMATKKAAVKKPATKKKAVKKAVKKEGGPGLIEQIIALHKQGYSNQEIAAKGFNKTTISIQVGKYKKLKAAKKK